MFSKAIVPKGTNARFCLSAVFISMLSMGTTSVNAQQATPDWTGFYLAVGGGFAWTDFDVDIDIDGTSMQREQFCKIKKRRRPPTPPPGPYNIIAAPPPPPPPPVWVCNRPKKKSHDFAYNESFNKETNHGFGTVQLEYKQDFGDFVISAFVDADKYMGSDENFSDFESYKKSFFAIDGSIDLDYSATIGGTLGFKLNPDTLIYGLVGWTYLKLDSDLSLSSGVYHGHKAMKEPIELHSASLSMPDELDGLTLGAGFQTRLSETMSFKVEYRYTDFGDDSASSTFSSYDKSVKYGKGTKLIKESKITGTANSEIDAEMHAIRAMIVFKISNGL